MKDIIYNKLVRDNILDIIESDGHSQTSYIASDALLGDFLIKKVQEELEEFRENPSLEEMADILEVLDSMKDFYGFNDQELLNVKNQKKALRGGFDKGIILERVTEGI